MASISQYLSRIKQAIYGSEVRDSIYDALQAMNIETENATTQAIGNKESAREYAESSQTYYDMTAEKYQAAAQAASTATEKANQITEIMNNVDQYVDSASESASSASESAETARQYAQDVVDQKVNIDSLDQSTAFSDSDLFIVSSNGVNKSISGLKVKEALSGSGSEDSSITIGNNQVVETTDSGVTTTVFSKSNGNDVITSTYVPVVGEYNYITETTISGNNISVTHSVVSKEG